MGIPRRDHVGWGEWAMREGFMEEAAIQQILEDGYKSDKTRGQMTLQREEWRV